MYAKVEINLDEIIDSLYLYDKVELAKELATKYLDCKEIIELAINNYTVEEVLDNIEENDIKDFLGRNE